MKTIYLLVGFFLANQALAAPVLDQYRTFKLYFKQGEAWFFNQAGIREKITPDNTSYKDGEIVYMIIKNGQGKMIGNMGSSEVAVTQGTDVITFVEIPPSGVHQTTTIYNIWNDREQGFLFVYSRNFPRFGQGAIFTNFYGYAKPWD
jgi:hypothetical protein